MNCKLLKCFSNNKMSFTEEVLRVCFLQFQVNVFLQSYNLLLFLQKEKKQTLYLQITQEKFIQLQTKHLCQNLISCPKENLIGTANTQIPQKRGKAQPCTPSIVIQDIADTQVSPSPLIREHSEWCTEKKLLLGSSSLQHLLLHFPAEYPLLSNMEAYKICVPSRRLLVVGWGLLMKVEKGC